MIEQFNEIEMRDSGIIYNSVLEQVKKLYVVDPERAGELAISAIELTLTGQISSDDMMIELMLEPTKVSVGKNKIKYDQKVESSKQKKISEQKLDQIADMMQRGFKQREIAQKLGLTQQMVSYRWGIIRTTYPELLQKEEKDLQITLPNSYKKTNDTNNTKLTKVCIEEELVENGEEVKIDAEPSWKKEFSF